MRKNGFTLLELLVVIAILATVGGGLIVAYDGLDEKAAQGQATFNIAALDNNLRTFKTLNQGFGGGNFDSLLEATTTGGTTTGGASVSGTTANALNSLPPKLVGKLGAFELPLEGVQALAAIGVTQLRYVGSSLVDGDDNTGNTGPGSIPNRIFDNTTRGRGISRTLVADDHVAVVEAEGVTLFGASTPASDSTRLRDIAGLDETLGHIVVAVGIGNNATLVKASGGGLEGGLSEAPLYTNVPKTQYGRFIALFHVATDTADDGFGTEDYFGTAQFLGVIDTKGDWYDEEFAEYTGQKS